MLAAAKDGIQAASWQTAKFDAAGGLDPYVTTPEEFSALIGRDHPKYAKYAKVVGIKLD